MHRLLSFFNVMMLDFLHNLDMFLLCVMLSNLAAVGRLRGLNALLMNNFFDHLRIVPLMMSDVHFLMHLLMNFLNV